MKLKIDAGQQLIEQARKQNPNNLIPELLEGYIDFFGYFLTKTRLNTPHAKPILINASTHSIKALKKSILFIQQSINPSSTGSGSYKIW